MLIIAGGKDHTVPFAISNASFKKEKKNIGITEIVTFEDRGHAMTIDDRWQEVAETAVNFVKRFGS